MLGRGSPIAADAKVPARLSLSLRSSLVLKGLGLILFRIEVIQLSSSYVMVSAIERPSGAI